MNYPGVDLPLMTAEQRDDTATATPPDAIRVWRGQRRADLSPEVFAGKLERVFAPATVEMLRPLGLVAYMPTLLAPADDAVPDELALVFYASQQHYRDARKTVMGRAYAELHGVVFSDASTSAFPVRFTGELESATPYYLFDNAVDWRLGCTEVLVARLANAGHRQLLSHLRELQNTAREDVASGLDGYIFVLDKGLFIRWAHFTDERQQTTLVPEPGLREPLHSSRSREYWFAIDSAANARPAEQEIRLEPGMTLNVRWSSEASLPLCSAVAD